MTMQNKVKDKHTRKNLYLYIRQSDERQVKDHTGSTDVQKAMYDRALQYGFPAENIKTVMTDQGRSATSVEGRVGFEEMLTDIRSGEVGAVLCYHTSRLGRNAADMQRLINICAATDTLIIDAQGAYDMANENDFMLVNFKSIIDAAEIRRMVALAKAAKLAKAHKGELIIPIPIGFTWVGSKKEPKIVLARNKKVRKVLQTIFKQFRRCKTGHGVVKYCNERGLLFPTSHSWDVEPTYEWGKLTNFSVLNILHNPVYAGSYVYGMYTYEPKVLPDGSTARYPVRKDLSPEDWAVHIRNHHKGYISFEEFLSNQEQLKSNRNYSQAGFPSGAPKGGAALLQGVLRCGKCKQKTSIRYRGRNDYLYACFKMNNVYGESYCVCVRGKYIDEAVKEKLLEAFSPTQMELSVAAAKTVKRRAADESKEWGDTVRQARLRSEKAEKLFKAASKRNRLVTEKLEAEWEQSLKEVKELERKRDAALRSKPPTLDSSNIDEIMALAKDMPTMWHAPQMSQVDRKHLVRALIEEVVVIKIERTAHISIKWKTGIWTETSATIPGTGTYSRVNDTVNNIIRELIPTHTDQQIADHLNRNDHVTFLKRKFTRQSIASLSHTHGLGRVISTEGRVKIPEASKILGKQPTTVNQMCLDGKLDAIRSRLGAPWWIKLPA